MLALIYSTSRIRHGISINLQVNCETFGTMAMKFGGPLFRYLQIFGILLVSFWESMTDDVWFLDL